VSDIPPSGAYGMKRHWALTVIVMLLAANAITGVIAGRYADENRVLKLRLVGHAAHTGEIVAIEDYRADRKRILKPVSALGSEGVAFTGQIDDQLPVWNWPTLTEERQDADRYNETFIDAYNNRMRLMKAFPNQFKGNYDHLRVVDRSGRDD
jgi:hypothetical protein